MQRRALLSLLAGSMAALSATSPAPAVAGAYPDHPVKILVALPAGGSVDMIARLIGQYLSTELGQAFVIDNKGGASGQIGLPAVARAAADGYTLTVSPASFLTTNKSIFKSLPYDPQNDFAPITKLVNQPMVLVVKDRQKYPSVSAVLSAAKAKPGALSYASSGDGSPQHLAALMFETQTQTSLLHVPYRGGAPAINDMLAGNVDLLFAPLPEALPYLKTGALHAIGIMSERRSPLLADTPTMQESAIPGLTLSAWIGLLAPAGTPPAIIERLNRHVGVILSSPAMQSKLGDNGMELAPSTPEALRQTIAEEIALHAELVQRAGLQPQ